MLFCGLLLLLLCCAGPGPGRRPDVVASIFRMFKVTENVDFLVFLRLEPLKMFLKMLVDKPGLHKSTQKCFRFN